MEAQKRDLNGSLPSSLDSSSMSSPSTTTSPTTPTITIQDMSVGDTPNTKTNDDNDNMADNMKPPADDGGDVSNASPTTTTENGQAVTLASSPSTKRDSSHGSSQDKREVNTVPPPDGGWGWVVVFSSFLIHVIADGVVYTFGIFLIEFVEVFNVGRGPASWIGALQPAVTFSVGPLASALTNRYGCRPVTMVGALIAAAGFVLSVFAPNLYYLYATCGVMTGLGFGLIYLPAIVSVAQYFEKRRSFATGLAVCGSGFGTFILAPITEMLVHEYSWRGAMLILGGIILNVVVCGILFRPLEASGAVDNDDSEGDETDNGEEKKALLKHADGTITTSTTANSTEMVPMRSENNKDGKDTEEQEMTFLIKRHHGGEGGAEWENKNNHVSSLEVIPLSKSNGGGGGAAGQQQNVNKNHPVKSAPVAGGGMGVGAVTTSDTDILISSIVTDHGDVHDKDGDDVLSSPTTSEVVLLNSFQVHVDFPSEMDDNLREISASQCLSVPANGKKGQDPASLARSDGAIHRRFHTGNQRPANKSTASPAVTRRRTRTGSHSSSTSSNHNTLAPLSRKDIFYSGSLMNIPMYRSQPDVYLATVTPVSPSHHHHHKAKGKDVEGGGGDDWVDRGRDSSSQNKCFEFSREFRSTMKEMMSFSLLKNPVFLMFAISNFLTSIGFNMPFIFLPDRAQLSGIDENKAAYLLSIIGIANTAGRIIFGFMADRSWVNRLFLYNCALTICGVATALSTVWGDSYAAFVAYAAIFGIFIGVYVSLTSVVLVDLLGLEYLTNSFGLLLLFQGAATFIGPPIAGMLYDGTGSYDISFIVMGTLIALSGAMLFLLPCVQRHHNRKCPVVDIIREVDLGRQIQGDQEMAEIIHSREVIPPSSH